MKRRKKRTATVAIGTWPTPEKPARRRKKTTRVAKKRRGTRAIDTVPLPERPRRRKKKSATKRKKAKKKK